MTTWHALFYPLKEGSEEEVKNLFKASGRPRFDVTDESGTTVGRLLGTMAFVGAGKAIRVMEVDGSLPQVAAHMSRQAEVRAFEDKLEDHLSVPRDMRSPEGARAFFREAALESVQVAVNKQGDASEWFGVYYPLAPGHEQAVKDLTGTGERPDLSFRGGGGPPAGVRGMLFFVGKEKALRLVRTSGSPQDFMGHMAGQPGAQRFQAALDEHLAVDRDMNSPESARNFFTQARVECVLSRRHDQEI